jgi:hypothetical protein
LDVEYILTQIRFAIIDGDARIDFNNSSNYTEDEAKIAFNRSVDVHGWGQKKKK